MKDLTLALENFPLEAYLTDIGGDFVSDSEFLMECPCCHKPKLSVNLDRRQWRCFVCERYSPDVAGKKRATFGAGNVLSLVELLGGLSKYDAIQFVLDHSKSVHVGIHELELVQAQDSRRRRNDRPITEKFPKIDFPEDCAPILEALPYMQKRGITLQQARLYSLLHCHSGFYANRIIFPVWDGDHAVYWQARAMWEKDQHDPATGPYKKTLNPKRREGQAGAGDVLFNLQNAKQYPRVAICEGPIDVIHAGPSAVATFGKTISPQQIARLIQAKVKFVDLMWDSDATEEMHRAAATLRGLFDVRVITLPHGDPGDFSTEEIDSFREAVSVAPPSRLSMI